MKKKYEFVDSMHQDYPDYYGYVYLIIDHLTKMKYIGQKMDKIYKTKNYFGSGTIINNIQNSRGTKHLQKIILGVCYSREELNEAETECIYFFRVYGSDGENYDEIYGYNLTKEAQTTSGYKHKKESIKKMKINRCGITAWNKGLTKETDERVKNYSIKSGETQRLNNQIYHNRIYTSPMKGLYGKNNPKSKPVLQYSKDNIFIKEYISLTEAASINNYSAGNLSTCLNGYSKFSYGFTWKWK